MRKLLIIHEAQALRTLLKRYLLSELDNIYFDESPKSLASLTKMQEQQYDLIVCAYQMKDLNGLELYWKSRELPLNPNKETPFLILTSSPSPELLAHITPGGPIHHMAAPFTAEELGQKIKATADPRKRRQGIRVTIAGTRAIFEAGTQQLEANVVNISKSGLLCDMDYPDSGLNIFDIERARIIFPPAMDSVRTEPIRVRILRLEVLSTHESLAPKVIRLVCQFIDVSEHNHTLLELIIDRGEKEMAELSMLNRAETVTGKDALR